MTTDHGQKHDPTVEAGYIRVKKNDKRLQKTNGRPAALMNDSIIMVPQLRIVSKNRIKKDLFQSFSRTPLMLEIEEAILSQFCPAVSEKHRNETNALKDKIKQLQESIIKKDAEILYRDELLKQYTSKGDPTLVSGETSV